MIRPLAILLALAPLPLAAQAPAPATPAAPTGRLEAGNPNHLRVLPLEGGRNFRDLGGYPAAGGKTVRWGLLFRSGSMAGLTANDYASLEKLGIRSICDFRDARERAAEPTKWATARKPDYWTGEVAMSVGSLPALARDGRPLTAEAARQATMSIYPKLPEIYADAYREMFRQLVAGQAPLAFNCTAGKDRTGVAAALLLTALGVPRATVRQDYALSEKAFDFRKLASGAAKDNPLGQLPPEVLAPILRSDPAYLDAAFTAIEKRYGSVGQYLAKRLGVGPREIATLRRRYLV